MSLVYIHSISIKSGLTRRNITIAHIGPTIIPDAAAIHLAKKKREQMRLRNDHEEEEFISLAGGDDDRVYTLPCCLSLAIDVLHDTLDRYANNFASTRFLITRWSRKGIHGWFGRRTTKWMMAKQVITWACRDL